MSARLAKILIKTAVVVSTFLFGFMMCVTAITSENKTAINNFFKTSEYKTFEPEDSPEVDTEYYKSRFSSVADLVTAGKAKAREIASEGIVLLKNEGGALPLKPESGEKKVSLFSISTIDPAYGGRGSAQTSNPLPPVTIKEGFEQAGFEVNGALHDFYSAPSSSVYKRVGRGDLAKINDAPFADIIASVGESGIASYGDAAFFLLTRVGGEGSDMAKQGTDGGDGSYLKLSATERGVLEGLAGLKANGKIKKIVILMNTSNQVETEFLDDPSLDIDAVLWIGSVGVNGFAAVGDIVAGKITPSGHLSDTFWRSHSLNPSVANVGAFVYEDYENFGLPVTQFGSADARYNTYSVYQEGIYVGYRYTETRYYDKVTGRDKVGDFDYAKTVSYPFGYGGSYTEFELSDFSLKENSDDTFTVSVKVTNTGDTYSGREVVQVYVHKPFTAYDIERGIEKSAIDLVGYAKTDTLKPKGSQVLTVTVDKADLTVYDSERAHAYIITEGDYLLTAAIDAHAAVNNVLAYEERSGTDAGGDSSLVGKVALKEDIKTYAVSAATGAKVENLFDFADVNKYFDKSENSVTYLSRTDWEGTMPKGNAVLKMTDKLKNDLLSQDDPKIIEKDKTAYPTYNKKSGLKLIDLMKDENGDPRAYDDPLWDALLDQLSWKETVELLNAGLQSTRSLISIMKPRTLDHNGPLGLTQAYNSNELGRAARVDDPDKTLTPPYYPSIGVLAATFDTSLASEFGDMLGEDAIWAGYGGFYGIGLNTHRSPFGGRAYEYFSEDPFLAGSMAACEVKALQSHGCNAYVKHFAMNDQEAQRAGISIWATEQTIREIYLKPFAKAVTEGGAMNAMSAFNRIGARHCAADSALLTDYLRGELGMKGLVVSDMYGIAYKQPQMPIFLMAGCDLPDGEIDKTNPYKQFRSDHGEVAVQMREAAKRILYATVQSNAMNGMSPYTQIVKIVPGWQIAVIVLDCLFGAMFAASIVGVVLTVAAKKRTARNSNNKGEKE